MTWPSTPAGVGRRRTLPAALRQARASRAFISAEAKLPSSTVWRYSAPWPLRRRGKRGHGSGIEAGSGYGDSGDGCGCQRRARRRVTASALLCCTGSRRQSPASLCPTLPSADTHLSAQSLTRIMSTPWPSLGIRLRESSTAVEGEGGERERGGLGASGSPAGALLAARAPNSDRHPRRFHRPPAARMRSSSTAAAPPPPTCRLPAIEGPSTTQPPFPTPPHPWPRAPSSASA